MIKIKLIYDKQEVKKKCIKELQTVSIKLKACDCETYKSRKFNYEIHSMKCG